VGEARPWRLPIAFRDEELHGFEPLLPPRIVAIAHADEAVTVLSEKLLRALLARPEMQPDRGADGGPAGGLEEARYGGPMGLGSWTTDADLHRRPSDSTAYETGSSLNTLGT
jgi:hypothetical protein